MTRALVVAISTATVCDPHTVCLSVGVALSEARCTAHAHISSDLACLCVIVPSARPCNVAFSSVSSDMRFRVPI